MAGAIAKRRERMFCAHAGALKGVEAYMATTRQATIRRAQRRGAYDQLRGKLVVTRISHGRQRKLTWRDPQGNQAEAAVSAIDAEDRRRLFIEGPGGLEPLQLWLTQGGMPMRHESWARRPRTPPPGSAARSSPQDGRRFLEESQFHVYDNPESFLTCNNDPAKALCHVGRTGRTKRDLPPAIDRCDPACSNIARTDTHIRQVRAEITQLAEEITDPLTLSPLRKRLKQRRQALHAIVDQHERTRSVPADPRNERRTGKRRDDR